MRDPNREQRSLGKRRSFWLVAGALAAVAGLVVGGGIAASRAEAGWGRHGWGHRGWGHHGDADLEPERAKEHIAWALGFALRRIDASDEQEARISAIVNDSIDGLIQGVAEHRARRGTLKELFAQPEIDREALENLRKTELKLADELSHDVVSAIADVAEVLTVEQRAELLEMHHHSRRWH